MKDSGTVPVPPSAKAKPRSDSGAFKKPRPARPASQVERTAKTAKFVTAEPTTTDLGLGEDGLLPNLVLEEPEKEETADEQAKQSSPVLLIAAVVFSFAVSAALLLFPTDTGSQTTGTDTEQDPRSIIREHYTGTGFLQLYQEELRLALRAR